MKFAQGKTLLRCAGFIPAWAVALAACADLSVVPDTEPQSVLGGDVRKIAIRLRNAGDQPVAAELRSRLLQASSATAVRLGEAPWKRIQVLPGQTIVESAQVSFPAVKAETRFLVQWLERTNTVIGKTDVLVYPTNLLNELKPLAGDDDGALGVFDPQNQLKPLLKNAKVDFVDLEDTGLESFRGKLAIIGPFQSKAQMRKGLADQLQALGKKNAAIVWIQPRPAKRDKLLPSFYAVPQNEIAIVVVQPELVVNLSENPQAQLNLIHFCKLALHPEPLHLPQSSP